MAFAQLSLAAGLGQVYHHLTDSTESLFTQILRFLPKIPSLKQPLAVVLVCPTNLSLCQRNFLGSGPLLEVLSGKNRSHFDKGEETISQICCKHQVWFSFPKLETCLGMGYPYVHLKFISNIFPFALKKICINTIILYRIDFCVVVFFFFTLV